MANPQVKGTGMVHVVKALRIRRDHVTPLLDGSLRRYLDEKILASSWYPTLDLLALLGTMVHFAPKSAGDPWLWMGRQSAEADLREIYAAMVQKGHAWATLQRLPRLWRLYHDQGKVEVGVAGATKAQVMLADFPLAHEGFATLINGYLYEMVRQCGTTAEVRTLQSGARQSRWLVQW